MAANRAHKAGHRRTHGALRAAAALLLAATGAFAQEPDPWLRFQQPWFEQITLDDGLTNSNVTALAQDADGYIWIGTRGGLARYDGQRFISFLPEQGKADSLPDRYVRSLLPLAGGRLLLGTNNAGVALFDSGSAGFTPVPLHAGFQQGVKVYSLRETVRGEVLVASTVGLDLYDPESGVAQAVPLTGLPGDHVPLVFDALEVANGALWIGTETGLWHRPAGETAFTRVADPVLLADELVWRLHEDLEGRLWVGTRTRGVMVIDPDGRRWAPPHLHGSTGLAFGHTIRAFAETAASGLWIATEGDGVIHCPDTDCQTPRVVASERGNVHSLNSDTVRSLLLGRSGVLWVGTSRGIARHIPASSAVVTLTANRLDDDAGSDHEVASVLIDRRDRIWMGLDSGGINVLDLAAGVERQVRLPGIRAEQVTLDLLEDLQGNLWAAGLGVLRINPDTLQPDHEIKGLSDQRMTSLSLLENGHILASTHTDVWDYDPVTDHLEPTGLYIDDAEKSPLQQVRWSVATGEERWFATINGLGVSHAGSRAVQLLRQNADNPESLPGDYLSALVHDIEHHRLWIATDNGLAWLDLDDPVRPWRFHLLDDPLTQQRFTALQLDAQGALWASGDNRLIRVDPASFAVTTVQRRDGLRGGIFSDRAATLGPRGAVLFGGSTGLTVVRPASLRAQTDEAEPLQVSRLIVNDSMRSLAIPAGMKLALADNERNVTMDFALLDFRAPRETRYAYRVIGLEEGWHQLAAGTLPGLAYTNLPTGEYTLQLRAEYGGLQPRTTLASYPLVVAPHAWETWPARLLQLLALLLAAGILVYAGLRWSHHRQRVLDHLIAQRTSELNEANARLAELASTDPLTGLRTRRSFIDVATRALADAHARRRPLSMIIIDIDHFKQVNDAHGHLAGDAVLTAVARSLLSACRNTDTVGRYGGDEMIACLPGTSAADAMLLATRWHEAISALPFRYAGTSLPVTCSVGVATTQGEELIELPALIDLADRALYEAKRRGRNQVASAATLPADTPTA